MTVGRLNQGGLKAPLRLNPGQLASVDVVTQRCREIGYPRIVLVAWGP